MRFLKRKSEHLAPGSDRLAARIAVRIIRWQVSFAAKINRRVNQYTKAGQRKFLWLFCAAWIAVICFNFFHLQKTAAIKAGQPNFLPAHIGQPSGTPKPAIKLSPKQIH